MEDQSLSESGLIRLKAMLGQVSAQYDLACDYDNKGNRIEAAKWYSKAAEQGHADAQYQLAFLYAFGMGVEENRTKANHLFEMSEKTKLQDKIAAELSEPKPSKLRKVFRRIFRYLRKT